MRTFLEVIEQRKTDKLAYECFGLMIERGIDPMKYVLWLQENDGLNNPNIRLESREWIDLELDAINESWLGHNVGWAVGKTPGWLAKGAGALAGEVGSWFRGAGQGLGSDIDQAMGRKGIQGSPASPTGYYDTETGHYVKWAGEEGKEDPNQKDQWKPVDHLGNDLPPNAPPPQRPAQQGGGQPGQQGGGQPQSQPPQQPSGGSPAQNAVQALQDLSKRANRRGSKLQQSGIQQMLFDLIQKLQDPNLAQQSAPQATTPAPQVQPTTPAPQAQPTTPAPQAQPTAPVQQSWTDHGFGSVLRKKLFETRLKNLADNLVEAKIDPNLFVEWYIDEGMHHESIEDFNEDFGQWAHGLWGGIKGLFNKKGFSGGWSEVDDDYDRQSAETALQAITPLLGKHPQIDQQLQALNKSLREFLWDKTAGGDQAAGGDAGSDQAAGGDPTSAQDDQAAQQNAASSGVNPQDPQALANAEIEALAKPTPELGAANSYRRKLQNVLKLDASKKDEIAAELLKLYQSGAKQIHKKVFNNLKLGASQPAPGDSGTGAGPVTNPTGADPSQPLSSTDPNDPDVLRRMGLEHTEEDFLNSIYGSKKKATWFN